MYVLLNQFYPEREITVTSSDPRHVTPPVKAMLRRKNCLMRAGRTDEADALSGRIRAIITRSSSKWLCKVDILKSSKYAWMKVRKVLRGTGKNLQTSRRPTAQVMNDHYAAISTDSEYRAPDSKHTARERADNFVTDSRYIATPSDRTRRYTCLVLEAWSTSICCAHCSAVQSIHI